MKKQTKILIAIVAAIVLIAAMIGVYFAAKPDTQTGAKTVTIKVIDNEQKTTEYVVHTDGEYLLNVMKDAKALGLTFDGEETEYGFSVYTINGVTADFNVDASYWSFYVNDEYCNYGVDAQPAADGDVFIIQYTMYK